MQQCACCGSIELRQGQIFPQLTECAKMRCPSHPDSGRCGNHPGQGELDGPHDSPRPRAVRIRRMEWN